MTNMNSENTLFMIIDIQEKLLNATFNKEVLAKKSEILAKTAEILKIPTVVTEQYPKGLGDTVNTVKAELPQETVFYEKTAFDALSDVNLCNLLIKYNRKNVILCGIETHICVYQTAKSLIEKGYSVTVLKDCCGSRCEEEHLSALSVLSNLGVKIKTTEMVLFELLKTAKHPNFKEIQTLIK